MILVTFGKYVEPLDLGLATSESDNFRGLFMAKWHGPLTPRPNCKNFVGLGATPSNIQRPWYCAGLTYVSAETALPQRARGASDTDHISAMLFKDWTCWLLQVRNAKGMKTAQVFVVGNVRL